MQARIFAIIFIRLKLQKSKIILQVVVELLIGRNKRVEHNLYRE